MEMKIERSEDHRGIACASCGASGANQYRHDTGRMMGWGRFELRCRCGHTTRYDIGCSLSIHAAMKRDVDTFLASTIYSEYKVEHRRIWAICPWCGSTLVRRIDLDILPPGARELVLDLEAHAA